ncbi:MAG: hypothetical protein AAGA30_16690 [Planctomycetota bacterium]
MLWIFFDALMIMLIHRLVTGELNESWLKPAIVAVLVWFAMFPVFIIESLESDVWLILILTFSGVWSTVFLSGWLILNQSTIHSVFTSTLFLVYKILFFVIVSAAIAVIAGWLQELFWDAIKRIE